MHELTKGVLYYEQLGLSFKRVADNFLRLTFTQIDASAPSREFTFVIHVGADNVYTVETCQPAVPRLRELLAELNGSNDFSGFVRGMRREFKGLCN